MTLMIHSVTTFLTFRITNMTALACLQLKILMILIFTTSTNMSSRLQVEWQARAATIQALTQLGINQSLTSGGRSEEEDDSPTTVSCIENIKITQEFIKEIRVATLENGNLDDDVIHQLRNPPEEPTNISDSDVRLSLDLFLAVTNASEETYHASHDAILRRYPDSGVLSYHAVKKLVAEITGVVAVYDDMCINSCHAFTGPFAQLQSCSICGEA